MFPMPFVTNVSAKMKTLRNEKCVYRSIMTGAATTNGKTRKDDSGDMGKLRKGVRPSRK